MLQNPCAMGKVHFENRRSTSFHPDIMNRLLERGDVKPIGQGSYVFQGEILRLIQAVDRLATRCARDLNAIEQEYPVRWPLEIFEDINYLADFPQNLIVCTGSRRDRAGQLAQDFPNGSKYKLTDMNRYFEEPRWALGTSTCDPCYYVYRNGSAAENRVYFAKSKCFRNERSERSELDRLTEFSMREVIAVGDEAFVMGMRARFFDYQVELMKDLEISGTIETASDPFFTNDADLKRKYQEKLDSKIELLAAIGQDRPALAISSLNWHGNHFGRCFNANLSSGKPLESSCLAFGLERMAFAVLIQHGLEAAKWPSKLRQAFEKPMAGFEPSTPFAPSGLFAKTAATRSKSRLAKHEIKACLDLAIQETFLISAAPETLARASHPGWDSIAHLSLITRLESDLGVEIPSSDFSRLHSSYSELLAYVSSLSASAEADGARG